MITNQSINIGLLAVDHHAQVFAKTAAGLWQSPDLLHIQTQATREAIGLHLGQHHNELIVFDPLAAGLVQGVIHARLHDGRLVIEFEQGHLAALAIDGAKVADDAAQDLRFAAVADFIHAAFDKLAHLGLHFIEQVP